MLEEERVPAGSACGKCGVAYRKAWTEKGPWDTVAAACNSNPKVNEEFELSIDILEGSEFQARAFRIVGGPPKWGQKPLPPPGTPPSPPPLQFLGSKRRTCWAHARYLR